MTYNVNGIHFTIYLQTTVSPAASRSELGLATEEGRVHYDVITSLVYSLIPFEPWNVCIGGGAVSE